MVIVRDPPWIKLLTLARNKIKIFKWPLPTSWLIKNQNTSLLDRGSILQPEYAQAMTSHQLEINNGKLSPKP